MRVGLLRKIWSCPSESWTPEKILDLPSKGWTPEDYLDLLQQGLDTKGLPGSAPARVGHQRTTWICPSEGWIGTWPNPGSTLWGVVTLTRSGFGDCPGLTSWDMDLHETYMCTDEQPDGNTNAFVSGSIQEINNTFAWMKCQFFRFYLREKHDVCFTYNVFNHTHFVKWFSSVLLGTFHGNNPQATKCRWLNLRQGTGLWTFFHLKRVWVLPASSHSIQLQMIHSGSTQHGNLMFCSYFLATWYKGHCTWNVVDTVSSFRWSPLHFVVAFQSEYFNSIWCHVSSNGPIITRRPLFSPCTEHWQMLHPLCMLTSLPFTGPTLSTSQRDGKPTTIFEPTLVQFFGTWTQTLEQISRASSLPSWIMQFMQKYSQLHTSKSTGWNWAFSTRTESLTQL